MVRAKRLGSILLVISILLCACAPFQYLDGAPQTVQDYYREYVEASKIDHGDAIREYEYIENEETKALLIAHYTGTRYVDAEILTWEQLSDLLWAVEETTTITNNGGETYTAWHFVCIVDGEYKVVKNAWHVTAEMQEGLDLSPYWPPGEPWEDYYPVV